ncbi:MAG: PA2778 family cysteine peptidase [Betaproteobacteria bacterium]|nr:PA2778 family cysteine peptidase [Betaproteobacteria bacterium]
MFDIYITPLIRASVLATLGLWLGGCATTMSPELPVSLPPRVSLDHVPFFPDNQEWCGPASLASTLSWAGDAVSPAALAPHVYSPERHGSLPLDLIGATRQQGLIPFVMPPHFSALLLELAHGHPVLVLQKVGLLEGTWHYAVAIGYDLPTQTLWLHSGTTARQTETFNYFEQTWSPGGDWALVITPSGTLPASAQENIYLDQIMPLEKFAPTLATQGYLNALTRWPESYRARMGLGNLAFQEHHYHMALQNYQQAVKEHPLEGDAFNNLAETWLFLGKLPEAHQAIVQALALGGAHREIYEKTFKEINESR